MTKKLLFFLATLYTAVAYSQDEQKGIYFTAGANLSNISSYKYPITPDGSVKDNYPVGYYIGLLYDVPLSKSSDNRSYLTFGLAVDVRRFEHQVNYEWESVYSSGSFSSVYNRTVNMTTSFTNIGIPVMFKHTFDNWRVYINIGFVLNWISTDATGQYNDQGQSNFFRGYENINTSINSSDTSVNSLGIDAKITFGYFFNKHLGGEILVQRGLSNVYESYNSYYGYNIADIEGGRFTAYSLGLVYRLYKSSGAAK